MNNIAMVFSMEKVGSSTVMQAFREIGRNPERGTRNNLDYLHPQENYEAIVTPVRDPIARNISYFFELYGNDLLRWKPSREQVFEHLIGKIDHDLPLTFFDGVYKPYIGVDIMKQPFPVSKGWKIYNRRLLIIQTGKLSECLPEAFEQIFGVRPPSIIRGRSGDSRAYGELYTHFVEWVKFPADYVSHMLDSDYTRHFYTKAAIEEMRQRWQQ